MSRAELERVLDFILNRADEEEFRVVLKACERRGRDRGAFAALGSTSSGALASKVAADIQERIPAVSPMPPAFGVVLSKREIRDLIEFLAEGD